MRLLLKSGVRVVGEQSAKGESRSYFPKQGEGVSPGEDRAYDRVVVVHGEDYRVLI